MKGTVYGVGVGPGDPELLTFKAARIISQCPVVAVPHTGTEKHMALEIVQHLLKDQEIVYCPLPMTKDPQVLDQSREESAEHICRYLEQGKDVAFLTIGDPGVYATYSYLHRRITNKGFAAKIVPGVPSFCAAAAALGRSLCEEKQPLHLLPASMEDLPQGLDLGGTKVVMKSGKQQQAVMDLLEQKQLLSRTALVERCSLPEQVVIPKLTQPVDTGYFTLLIVGEDDQWSTL